MSFAQYSAQIIIGNCIFQIILEHHTVHVKVWHVCRNKDDDIEDIYFFEVNTKYISSSESKT